MSTVPQVESRGFQPIEAREALPRWYAVQTRAKHEKKIADELQQKGIQSFTPTTRQVHRWSDRRAIVDVPLFPCYAFVQSVLTPRVRIAVLQMPGVFKFVGFSDGPTPIPDSEIEAVKSVLSARLPVCACGSVKRGGKVRIRGGALEGLEGTLVATSGERRLIVSVPLIQQAIQVVIEGYDVEPV